MKSALKLLYPGGQRNFKPDESLEAQTIARNSSFLTRISAHQDRLDKADRPFDFRIFTSSSG